MEHQKTIFDLLATSFLFRGLSPTRLQEITQKTKLHTYRTGQILIEEEMANDKVFLIFEGLVKIYKLTPDGKEVFLAIEKPGDYLGLMDLTDKPASATIETLMPTKVLVIHKKDMRILLEENSMLWKHMYRIILAKVEEYRHLQTITLSYDLQERTYRFLKFLAGFFQNKTIPLSHEHIAAIVGATRPRVTETLHALRNDKKITISPKRITLL